MAAAEAEAAAAGGVGDLKHTNGSVSRDVMQTVRRFVNSADSVVLALVGIYVTLSYNFWEAFRVYFDWTESLAITIQARKGERERQRDTG